MFVYLDYWSLIPISVIWIVNLVMFGVAVRNTNKVVAQPTSAEYRPETNFPVLKYRPTLVRQTVAEEEEEEEAPSHEESPSIFLNSTTAIFFPTCHLHLPHISNKVQLGKVNSSVCPTKATDIFHLQRIEKITHWQAKFYQAQVVVINSMFMVILVTIFYLVTISTTFNYHSNILDPFWFNTTVILCLISGVVRK